MLIDFENIEQKCEIACSSEEYKILINKVNKAKKIYFNRQRWTTFCSMPHVHGSI